MNETVLFWVIVALAYVAGAGMMAAVQLFRTPHVGHHQARQEAELEEPPPPPLPAPPVVHPRMTPVDDRGDPLGARPRTRHNGHDTMDVYDDGLRAGRAERARDSYAGGPVAAWENGGLPPPPPPAEVWNRRYTGGLS